MVSTPHYTAALLQLVRAQPRSYSHLHYVCRYFPSPGKLFQRENDVVTSRTTLCSNNARGYLGDVSTERVLKHEHRNIRAFSDRSTRSSEVRDSIIIHLENERLILDEEEFLAVCWTNGFDTPCCVCNGNFESTRDPPIRTIALAHELESATNNPNDGRKWPSLRIRNYHRRCARSKPNRELYVPVSHAWHEAVGKANFIGQTNPEASRLAIEVPISILRALPNMMGRNPEIWHDYISVPQWNRSLQKALVDNLPTVFRHNGPSVIHLDDIRESTLAGAMEPAGITPRPRPVDLLASARWSRRMWTVIEYAAMHSMYGPEVYLVSQDATVHREPNTMNRDFYQPIPIQSTAPKFIQTPDTYFYKTFNLGRVYWLLGDQECRTYRDRFVAACALLCSDSHYSDTAMYADLLSGYPRMVSALPHDLEEACLWISEWSLKRGDFTPLLLAPTASDLRRPYHKARWLRGHAAMSSTMWSDSAKTKSATHLLSVKADSILLRLKPMGVITRHLSLNAEGEHDSNAEQIFNLITASQHGILPDFEQFIERVFPPRFSWWSSSFSEIKSWECRAAKYPWFREPFRKDIERIRQLYLEICQLRKRTSVAGESVDSALRTKRTAFEAGVRVKFAKHACDANQVPEHLVNALCEACGQETPVRVNLWHSPGPSAKVYHIPGLAYECSLPEGVALIIDNGLIIGRSFYATPACNCDNLEEVELR